MSAPRNMDLAFYGPWGVGCLWVYFIITPTGFLLLAIFGATSGRPEISWLSGILGILLITLPIAALLRASKKYATWKIWAEERGWKEPSREKRAWKKEGVR